MKIEALVRLEKVVEINIHSGDLRVALTEDLDVNPESTLADIKLALISMATFLNGLSDQQIGLLGHDSREVIGHYLKAAAKRFKASRVKA